MFEVLIVGIVFAALVIGFAVGAVVGISYEHDIAARNLATVREAVRVEYAARVAYLERENRAAEALAHDGARALAALRFCRAAWAELKEATTRLRVSGRHEAARREVMTAEARLAEVLGSAPASGRRVRAVEKEVVNG